MKYTVIRETTFYGLTSYIVADGGRAIVLVSVFNSDHTMALIHDLVVHESRRRLGIGGRMLSKAEEVAEEMGADKIQMTTNPVSWQADWYKRRGYKVWGETMNWGRVWLVLEKDLRRSDASEPQATESAISNVD